MKFKEIDLLFPSWQVDLSRDIVIIIRSIIIIIEADSLITRVFEDVEKGDRAHQTVTTPPYRTTQQIHEVTEVTFDTTVLSFQTPDFRASLNIL